MFVGRGARVYPTLVGCALRPGRCLSPRSAARHLMNCACFSPSRGDRGRRLRRPLCRPGAHGILTEERDRGGRRRREHDRLDGVSCAALLRQPAIATEVRHPLPPRQPHGRVRPAHLVDEEPVAAQGVDAVLHGRCWSRASAIPRGPALRPPGRSGGRRPADAAGTRPARGRAAPGLRTSRGTRRTSSAERPRWRRRSSTAPRPRRRCAPP